VGPIKEDLSLIYSTMINFPVTVTGKLANLISEQENISNIEWTVYGKISRISKPSNFDLRYTYDAAGNRISKKLNGVTTWYVRDASGNVMSVYSHGASDYSNGQLSQIEVDLYGSSRLGISSRVTNMESEDNPGIALEGLGMAKFANFNRRKKFFELGNHLGNVLATVSDAKRGVSGDGSLVDRYESDVVSASDYYPFGMLQPDRSWDGGKYRYGFNGQEKSDEIKGEGNSYSALFWEYDPRVARRWNVDVRPKVWESPYVSFVNNPLSIIDPLGDTTYRFGSDGQFLERTDLHASGATGVIGHYKEFTDVNNKKFKGWVTDRSFNFNDLSIDKEQLDNLNPGDLGIRFISDANLSWIMNKSSIKNRSLLSRWDFALGESVGNRMDFNWNYTLPIAGLGAGDGDVIQFDQEGGFFLFEGYNTAYNVNDAGQFLWGYAMKKSGFSIAAAVLGANGHALISSGERDSEGDQRAIRNGYFYNVKLIKSSFRFTQPWANWMPSLQIIQPESPDAGIFKDLPAFGDRPRRR
jgi:hypothetical protein